MTDQQIEIIANKIGEVAPDQVSNFLNDPDAFNYSVLEDYSDFTDKYRSIDDFKNKITGDKVKSLETIYSDLRGEKPSTARLQSIKENYPFIDDKDIENYFKYRSDLKSGVDAINAKRYEEASKNYDEVSRANDDSYYNSMFANELARKAHIEGDDLKAFVQEGLGKAAGAADFAPLPVSLIGPALRVGQKYYGDEPIEVLPTLGDFAGAVVPDLVTAPAKLGWQALKSKIGRLGEIAEKTKLGSEINRLIYSDQIKGIQKSAEKDLDLFGSNLSNIRNLSDEELLKTYEMVNDPVVRSRLESVRKARAEKATSDENIHQMQYFVNHSPYITEKEAKVFREEAGKEAIQKEADLARANEDLLMTVADRESVVDLKTGQPTVKPFDKTGKLNPRYKDATLEDLSNYNRNTEDVSRKARLIKVALGAGSRKLMRSIPPFYTPIKEYNPKDTRESDIKWVINTYGKDWNPNYPPAEAKDNPILRAAYQKWLEEDGSYDNWLLKRENASKRGNE